MTVLDYATADFKPSALRALDRADAILLRTSGARLTPQRRGVSRKLFQGKPVFKIAPPEYGSDAVEQFVRARVGQSQGIAAKIG